MISKFILLFLTFFLFSGCNQHTGKQKNLEFSIDQKYKNTGFALIYTDELRKNKKISNKIDNRSLLIFHKTIKKIRLLK